MSDKMLTSSEASARYNLTRHELLNLERDNAIKVTYTNGGHRRYSDSDVARHANNSARIKDTPVDARPAPNYNELGVTALNRWGGTIYEERMPELRGSQGRLLLREMHWNDPVIYATLFAIGTSLKQTSFRIKAASDKPADKECAKFITECFDDFSQSWSDIMDQVVDPMLEQGVSIMEIVYQRRTKANSKYNDGRISWRKWATRPVESLTPGNEWRFGEHGSILGCNQTDPDTGNNIVLPIEKLLLFRTTSVPSNTPEGVPVHRAAYSSWYFSRNFSEIEGIGVERDLGGIPIIYLGNDCNLSATDPNSDYNLAKNLVVNLRSDEQAGVVIPKPKLGTAGDGQGMLLELLSASSSRAHDVGAIIDRYDKQKALVCLAQFILLGMGGRSGSFALSTTQSDLFTIAISSWLHKIADVINRIAIPRLIRLNIFPDVTEYPKLEFSDIGLPNLESLSWYINSLVGNNLLKPDDELERHLRLIARLPEPEPNLDKTRTPEAGMLKPSETALMIRRVLLALKELPTYEGMSDEQLTALVQPLIEQLRLGIMEQTGQNIPEMVDSMLSGSVIDQTATADKGTAAKKPVVAPRPVARADRRLTKGMRFNG